MSTTTTLPPPISHTRAPSSSNSDTTATADTIDVEKTALDNVDLENPHHQTPLKLSDEPLEDPDVFHLPEKRPKLKRTWNLPTFSTHRRLIATMALVNLGLLALGLALQWWDDLPIIGYMLVGNIFVAVLVRQQRFVNFLFKFATLTGTVLPLNVRWALGKIYHFGGLHSGCAVSALVWLILFTISATIQLANGVPEGEKGPSEITVFITYLVLILLAVMIFMALPQNRSKYHNSFEATHRFLGWTVLLIVWVHTIFLIRDYKGDDVSHAKAFFTSVTPYLLAFITLSIASPWFYLRKVPVKVSKPSNHVVIVQFEEGVKDAFPGSSSAISVSPLYEWHSFANIPKPHMKGFRLVISRAGDWTSSIIDKPPTHFWIRGIPTAGVANIEVLFRKVLYVCTGSGIGPVLPHLLAKDVPSKLFWSTRTPEVTYGHELVQEIYDASPDAVVHDTTLLGKPDMVATAYRMAKECDAEAVIVISNQKLTRKIVYGMESRGIPAFGAIWDS